MADEIKHIADMAKAAMEERFKHRLATSDQRNGYEVGWYEGYVAAKSEKGYIPIPSEEVTNAKG